MGKQYKWVGIAYCGRRNAIKEDAGDAGVLGFWVWLLKRHARRDRDVGFKMEGIGEGFTSYGETV